ncbi:hypothetical protein [Methanosarcina sp.]|uniref:hypothetical protein n=1 Tax=Methanosarcina sp. TaxID=2213 RepID=UPI003C793E2C
MHCGRSCSSLAIQAIGDRPKERNTAAPIGPELPASSDSKPVVAPPKTSVLSLGLNFNLPKYLRTTNKIKTAPILPVTVIFERIENPKWWFSFAFACSNPVRRCGICGSGTYHRTIDRQPVKDIIRAKPD